LDAGSNPALVTSHELVLMEVKRGTRVPQRGESGDAAAKAGAATLLAIVSRPSRRGRRLEPGMEENPTLLRLKELETLEKVTEKWTGSPSTTVWRAC
jgi:hypothetical protein